jgi:hypothetical protein
VKEVLLFCKKAAKNFLIWVRGVSLPKPLAQIQESFCAAFFKKRLFSLKNFFRVGWTSGQSRGASATL